VDGKNLGTSTGEFGPGEHIVQAILPGYKSATKTFRISDGNRRHAINFDLEPEPLRIRLVWDLKEGQVKLDDRPEQAIQEDEFTAELTPGVNHTLRLMVAGREAFAATFRMNPGELPIMTPVSSAPDLEATVIASLAGRARVYTSNPALKSVLKDGTLVTIPAQGLDVDVTAAPELILRDNRSVRPPLTLEAGNAPVLRIVATSDLTTATLRVQVSPPDAVVTMDKRTLNLNKNGQGQVRRPPGQYTLRAEREGYTPEAQPVTLKKADSQTLQIALKPVVKPISLSIDGAPAGAAIVLDGTPFATTDSSGHYENEGGIPEGGHSVVLRKDSYEDRVLGSLTFAPGQPVHIDGRMIAFGFIDFTVPANTTVKWRSADGTVNGEGDGRSPAHVKSAHYTVIAENPAYSGYQQDVFVPAGGRERFSWSPLRPTPEEKKTAGDAKPAPAEVFERPQDWKQSGPFRTHTASGFGWVAKGDGAFTLSTPKPKGGFARFGDKHLTWVVDYKDERNQVEYSLHPNGDIERRATVNGKVEKEKLSLGSRETYIFRIDIGKDRIIVASGDKTDAYRRPNPLEPLGKFGFKSDATVQVVQER